jgi:chemotaxis protein MotB
MEPVEVGEQGTSGELTILDSQMGTTGEPSAIDLDMPYTGVGEGDGDGEGALDRIAEDFTKNLSPLIDQDLINVTQTEDWVEVEIKSSLLYGSGSAELEDEAIPILGRLAEILQRYPNQIQVEGFTDNLPIRNYLFPSNWELSAARAAGVVNLFMRSGVEPDRMSAVGYGEFKPIADNNTAEGRSKNRRVVLVIMSRDMERRSIGGTRSPAEGEQG